MWYGGAGLCGGLPGGVGGHRVQVWWGGLSPVAGPLAVWGSPAPSLGRPPGVFQYVGRAGSVWRGAWGPLGRGVWDWSVATRGVWSCGAWGCRPTVEWAQWCGDRRVWATRGLLRLRGPRVGGSRHLGRVVAPVRRPRVVSGSVWLGCIVSMVGGGAMCSGVGWPRGRLPAGSGCRGLTVGGSSAVSPWCVPWWSLVGWLKGVFRVYRIHGGTIVCWRAAAGGAVGCRVGACVCVVRVVGGGASCVVLGGSSWWSVVVVPGGCSSAWRFLGGCGTCGVGLAWGGGRVCGPACLPSALPAVSSSAFPLLLSFCLLVLLCFFSFFGGGGDRGVAFLVLCVGVGLCRCRFWCGRGCRGGAGVGWLLRSGFPVCAPAPRLPVSRAPARGVLTVGGCRQWWRGACVGGCGSWVVPGWRGRARACVWVCSWRGLMGWWAVWAWLVCVGVG